MTEYKLVVLRRSAECLIRPFRLWLAVALACTCAVGSGADEDFPWLDQLDPDEGFRESGERLMNLPLGLHALEQEPESPSRILIGVHGWASRGYEWIYPLQTLDDEATTTYFFRWDFSKCARPSAELLLAAVREHLEADEGEVALTVIGHSYGGVLVSHFVDLYDIRSPVSVHAVAAPLARPSVNEECESKLPSRISRYVRFFQWRTQHKLDGAFQNMPTDPQIVDIPGSLAVTLPDTYRGRRLGHNWSISWVADRLSTAEGTSPTEADDHDGGGDPKPD